ncbi:hypothetical protein ACTA71_012117 [Dictyostelium dimigraforme]
MLLKKSLLLLVAFILAFVAVSSATKYSEFTVSGEGCTDAPIKGENGACQKVCAIYGKIYPTSDESKFNLNVFQDKDCINPAVNQTLTCLPNNKPLTPLMGYTITCLDSSSSSIVASIALTIFGILFALF